MKKVMLWPDLYREQGHWLPAVNLAHSLLDAGYAIDFMGIRDCASIVEPYDAPFTAVLEELYPAGHTNNDRLEPIGQRWKPHHLLPLARGELDGLFTGQGKPDLLIAGYFVGLEALILHYKYDVPLIVLTTYLRHPDEDPAIFAKGKLVYMPEAVARKIITTATGRDMSLEEFIAPLEEAQELIPCPREFDFYDDDWNHREGVHYVEPMIERLMLDGSGGVPLPPPDDGNGDGAVNGRDPIYHPIPEPGEKKIIFATAGSQVADYEDKAREFFLNLIGMMKTSGMNDYHLVLSIGDKLLEEFRILFEIDKDAVNNKLPSNVTIAAWVFQLDILKQAHAVFMHGGLATIKEAVINNVPLVILPHGKDQTENALRIRRTGVGISSETGKVTPQSLKTLLTKVTTSKWVNASLEKMSTLFTDAETSKPSIAVIQGVVPSAEENP